MKKINNIFNTANKSLFAIGDTSRRSTPDSSGQRRILLSSCRGPISPLARGVPARAGCRKFGVRFAALVALFVATPSFAEPTELDKKTVASKAYVDTKQDIITTGLVVFEDGAVQGGTSGEDDLTVRALVATNAAGTTLTGNTIGILDANTLGTSNGGALSAYAGYGAEMDNFVPTVRAVADAIKPPLNWSSTQSNAINAYNATFGNGTNQWAGNSDNLITGRFLANSLALKQNKLPTKSTGNTAPTGNQAVVLNTAGNPSNVYTTAGKDLALTAKSGAQKVMNYIDGTTTLSTFAISQGLTEGRVKSALVSLELLKDVYDVLNTKITNNALPTGTTGTVVTYNGTNATTGVQEFTETAMTGTVTYTNGTLDNANDIATITAVGTRQKKKECGGYEPAAAGQPAHDGTHPGDEDYCWLWIFPED